MKKFTGQKTETVGEGDYSSIANCQTKIPVIFRGIFGTPRDILKFLCVYFTTSLRTPYCIYSYRPMLHDICFFLTSMCTKGMSSSPV